MAVAVKVTAAGAQTAAAAATVNGSGGGIRRSGAVAIHASM
jgi:hypothetical protein